MEETQPLPEMVLKARWERGRHILAFPLLPDSSTSASFGWTNQKSTDREMQPGRIVFLWFRAKQSRCREGNELETIRQTSGSLVLWCFTMISPWCVSFKIFVLVTLLALSRNFKVGLSALVSQFSNFFSHFPALHFSFPFWEIASPLSSKDIWNF